MKVSVFYTVLTLVNLIAFAVGVVLLPGSVAVHFDGNLAADRLGSAWVYVAFPAAAALISAGVWITALRKKSVVTALLCTLGGVLSCMGWTFFSLAAQGTELGMSAVFPFSLVSVLPIGLILTGFGFFLVCSRETVARSRAFRAISALRDDPARMRVLRVSGIALCSAGLLSSATAVVLGCIPVLPRLDLIAAIVMLATLLIALAVIFASILSAAKRTQD